MSLLQFLRLLGRHAALLVLVPLAMAAAAFWATRDLPREYAASATLYTGFVSGYSIDSENGARADYLTTQTAFDNLIQLIKSRRAVEHVALTLLAMEASGELRLEDYDAQEATGLVRTVAARGGRASTEATYTRFAAQKNEIESPVYAALYVDPSPFNVSTLQGAIQANRVGNSDMVEVRYNAPDATLAQVTLQILLDQVVTEFREMKTRETSDIVAFFEEETAVANQSLRSAVSGMRDFGVRNRIINYYEQTKYVASQKEQLDHEVQQEQMALAASEGALRDTERRLSEREAVLIQSESVAEQRRALSAATARLARAEAIAIPAAPGEKAPASGAADTATVDSLRAELDSAVRGLHRLTHSEQGVSRSTLTGAWLEHATTVTEGRARLAVLRQRRDEYQRVYDVFAPLGSTLNSLEREVDIAEGTYMEMLQSLNLARMRQKSLEQSANLDVVAAPERPARPLSSKRPLLVAVAFMAGLVLCVGSLLGVEILDQSMRTPERAAEVSGLPLAGAYPVAPATETLLKPLDAQFLRNVALALRERDAQEPQLVVVASGQSGEGAGFVAARLAERFAARGRSVRYLAPHAEGGATAYEVSDAFPETETPDELASGVPGNTASGAEITILELPPVLDAPLPLGLLAHADVTLLAARASRSWSTADAHTAEALERASGHAPHLVLTGAQPMRLEGLVGDLPRKRSGVRRLAKRLARFEFSR
ncbi:GumC family protein [Rubricoccus marinus]|uniref:Polysaccharide chain length determinant N-terminal domain-containing protein n=1 Tax=Rubricoccus marinus TaxID=716817 RepID=A0A259TV29_9BACT|nr:hypothetical protein [Rubricoccus marinus]OZC01550.1 hypothetical protein BSZ36_00255 [Rubricoccus marinus]